MKKILCKLGIHKWIYPNIFARTCNRCGRLDEVHNDKPSTSTWNLVAEDGDYWVTTRKSNYEHKRSA